MSTQTTSTEPFTYVLIPLIGIFTIGSIAVFFQMRKRRRLDLNYGRPAPAGSLPAGATVLRIRRNSTRSNEEGLNEGLNELGQAPPPYEGKKTAQQQGQREGDRTSGNELRDLEEGRRPPEYVAEPQPAVIAERRTLQTEGNE